MINRHLAIRECWVTSDEEYLNYLHERDKWKDVATLVMIRSERQIDEHLFKFRPG